MSQGNDYSLFLHKLSPVPNSEVPLAQESTERKQTLNTYPKNSIMLPSHLQQH